MAGGKSVKRGMKIIYETIRHSWRLYKETGFPGGSLVKNLAPVQETRLPSLGREDPLEEEMATHSSTLAWEIPWTEEPGRLQSMRSQRVGHNLATETTNTRIHDEL